MQKKPKKNNIRMTETFHIVQVDASPNQCRLTDELVLTLTVETEASLLINACVTLILDVAYVCYNPSITRLPIDQEENTSGTN